MKMRKAAILFGILVGMGLAEGPALADQPHAMMADFWVIANDAEMRCDGVRAKLQATYVKQVLKCYSDALKSEPKLAGNVVVTLTVAGEGAVTEAEADGSSANVSHCLEGVAPTWRFAKAKKKDSTARFEVTFSLYRK
jgi:hypothetical protein